MPTIQTRLSSSGNFWLKVTMGALTFLVAAWLFGGIAEDVVNGDPLTLLDVQLADWFHALSVPLLTLAMRVISELHGVPAISLAAVLFAAFLIRKRDWYWLKLLVLAVPGGMLLNVLVKEIFARARPSFSDPIVVLASYSFPSGHVAGSTLFYGVLTAFLVARIDSWSGRAAVVLLAFVMVALVAVSRLYLGVHYLSDVLAAFAEGVAWLAVCFLALHTLRRHRTGEK
jgi:membrane-associated phospholipid phosphatase